MLGTCLGSPSLGLWLSDTETSRLKKDRKSKETKESNKLLTQQGRSLLV